MVPNARINLRRYASHWREGWVYMLGANIAVALGVAGIDFVLPNSMPLPARAAIVIATGVLLVAAAIYRSRSRLRAVAASIDLSTTHLVLRLGGGAPRTIPMASLTVRRIAYLRGESELRDHVPVLELRIPGGPMLRIVGPDAPPWPDFDAELDAPPKYTVDANDWAPLCSSIETGASVR